MAEKTNRKENTVRLEGYVKEDNLELIVNNRGDKVVRGNITIATNKEGTNCQKVQFYVSENTRNGEHSKDYDSLLELLPSNVVSVATYLEDNPGSSFADASSAATKVWIIARLEEFARRSGERVDSMITIKGFRAGLKKTTDKTPFTPKAEFSMDVYLEDIKPEENDNEVETGRLLVSGIFLDYKGTAHKVNFVAPTEDGIASYVKDHYKVGGTVNLKGDLVDLMIREIDENAEDSFFGRGNSVQYKTTFVHERKILGGSKKPLSEGEEGAYSKKAITDGLAAREIVMDENGKRAAARANGETSSVPAPTPVVSAPTPVATPKGFGSDDSDLDF